MPIVAGDTSNVAEVSGYPHDWTEGTGVIPASGTISIPNPAVKGLSRQWLFIQNQSAVTITVTVTAVKADMTTTVNATILLAPGSLAGTQGGAYEQMHSVFSIGGAITVSGTAGSQVAVLEKLK